MTTIFIPQAVGSSVVAEIRSLLKTVPQLANDPLHIEHDDNISVAYISQTSTAHLTLLAKIRDLIQSRTYFR